MHFASSYYLRVIYRTGFLRPFFDFHVIYRLPFSISRLFTGSLFRFSCYLQAPFFNLQVIVFAGSILQFTGSLFQFTGYLQAPLFNLHVIYRFPFSISMLFTDSLFPFTCYLQAPFFHLHVIYRLPFSIYMLFTGSLF